MKELKKLLESELIDIGEFSLTMGKAVGVMLAMLVAGLIIRSIRFAIKRRTRNDREKRSRWHSAFLLAKYAIWLATFVVSLEIIGIDLTWLLAGSAALLVGLGLGIQQTFNDIVSGIIILMEGTIHVGDVLEVEGLVGRVTEINLRTSTIYSRDGMNVIVPNHRFINENVVNWSHDALETRFRFTVGVAYGSDPETVKRILRECTLEHPMVISDEQDHATLVRLIDFGNSSLDFELLFWSRNIFFIEQTKSELRFAILEGFRKAGVVIPFPQRDVHIIQHGAHASTEETGPTGRDRDMR